MASKRLAWAIALTAMAGAGWVFSRLYQAPRVYDQYLPAMHSFLAAAIDRDSAALVAAGASFPAIEWGLRAGREKPRALQELDRGLGAGWGGPSERPRDSIVVVFRGPRGGVCYNQPVLVTFAGPPTAARVLNVSAGCLAQ